MSMKAYVFFGLLKVNGGVRIFLVYLRSTCTYFLVYLSQRRCTYSFGLLKVNGGVRILLVYLRSTEVYVFFWFT